MRKTILITGCSSGFGKAAVHRFLAEGWNVVATMRDLTRWDAGKHERLLLLALDVTDAASIAAAFDQATAHFKRLDVIVNNAGAGLLSVFEATPVSVIQKLFDTNLFGPMAVMRHAIPLMRAQGGGTIVNLTAGSAIVPEPLMSIYSASKAALDNFSESVMYELEPQGIRIKLIEPGFVPTTGFVQQTQSAATAVQIPSSYARYVGQRIASYTSEPKVTLATDSEVATALYAAATDVSNRLRWVVGADIAQSTRLRWETSEREYQASARQQFACR